MDKEWKFLVWHYRNAGLRSGRSGF